ncbi:MAG: hypothetical protein AB4080_04880 [Trichodesmium sp.]
MPSSPQKVLLNTGMIEADTETRRHEDTETRRHGDTGTRRQGDTETRGL